jgi:hypothetical protein
LFLACKIIRSLIIHKKFRKAIFLMMLEISLAVAQVLLSKMISEISIKVKRFHKLHIKIKTIILNNLLVNSIWASQIWINNIQKITIQKIHILKEKIQNFLLNKKTIIFIIEILLQNMEIIAFKTTINLKR